MTSFTPLEASLGGALIGVAAADMLLVHGRVAGISGIFSGTLTAKKVDPWRFAFVGGLVAGALVNSQLNPSQAEKLPMLAPMGALQILLAGFIVGVGTKLGSGCTSGHGVCGLARLSTRSLAAVVTFMGTGALTASLLWSFTSGSSIANASITLAPLRSGSSWFGLKALGACVGGLWASAKARQPVLNTFLSGLTFGLGLCVSGMSQQAKVIGFLNPFSKSRWDPSLAFVMGGAMSVSAAGYQVYLRRGRRPALGTVAGSALFGVGWGLGGLCPGPAIADLSAMIVGATGGGAAWNPLLFVLAMSAGMVLTEKAMAARVAGAHPAQSSTSLGVFPGGQSSGDLLKPPKGGYKLG